MRKPNWFWLCWFSILYGIGDFILGVPGRIDDWNTWEKWLKDLRMLNIDISNLIVAAVFSFGLIMWLREKRAERTGKAKYQSQASERVEPPVSRVPATIDPEQSQISYYGAAGLRVEVYITIENGLDIEARLSKLELKADTAKESLSCRFVAFQPDPFADYIQQIGGIVLPARKEIKGWAHFQRKEGLRTDDFKRFVLMVQAIGEPEEEHTFEPYDWGDARQGQSTIVMPPSGTKQYPVSDRIEIDKRILGIIADLEQGGRPFNNRNVWDYLTDDRTSYIDERLIHLKETGYITATIGPKRFIGATVSSPIREIEVHGLTDKGRLLLRRTSKQS